MRTALLAVLGCSCATGLGAVPAVDGHAADAAGSASDLARAPYTCGDATTAAAIAGDFPGWSPFSYAAAAQTGLTNPVFYKCSEGSTAVYGLQISYTGSAATSPPSISLLRGSDVDAFDMSYVVEGVAQIEESQTSAAGTIAFSVVQAVGESPQQLGMFYMAHAPGGAFAWHTEYDVGGALQSGSDAEPSIALAPPFRVQMHGAVTAGVLAIDTTLTTATATTTFTTSVNGPSPAISLTLGINRYAPTGASTLVVSDVVLP